MASNKIDCLLVTQSNAEEMTMQSILFFWISDFYLSFQAEQTL